MDYRSYIISIKLIRHLGPFRNCIELIQIFYRPNRPLYVILYIPQAEGLSSSEDTTATLGIVGWGIFIVERTIFLVTTGEESLSFCDESDVDIDVP